MFSKVFWSKKLKAKWLQPPEAPQVLCNTLPLVFYGLYKKDRLYFKIDMCVSMVLLHLCITKSNTNNNQQSQLSLSIEKQNKNP